MTANRQLSEWYSGKMAIKDKINDELSVPADLVVVGVADRKVKSITVWTDIRLKGRLERLSAREQCCYGDDYEVVAVQARSVGLGDILLNSQIIKL